MTEPHYHPAVLRPLQARFLAIPQTPLCYWLRERFFELLAGPTLGDVADVCQGLATANDVRFVRFVWEASLGEWTRPVRGRRWVAFEKGGGYGKWCGHQFWVVDWQGGGARLKASPTVVVRNEERYFEEGWTYSYMARGSLGLLLLDGVSVFSSHAAAGIFPMPLNGGCLAVANCRFASAIIRSISAKIQLNESYVSRVPVPESMPAVLTPLQSARVVLKRQLVAGDPMERTCVVSRERAPEVPDDESSGYDRSPRERGLAVAGPAQTEQACFSRRTNAARRLIAGRTQQTPATDDAEAIAAVLHGIEGIVEHAVFAAYGTAGDNLAAVLDETGTPTGWYPLIRGYDALPPLPDGLAVPDEVLALLGQEPRVAADAVDLAAVKRRLRSLYEAGPGGNAEDGEDEEAATGDEAAEAVSLGARIPIPTETFLEALAQKLQVHPISVYWLLEELRHEGVRCKPEEQRLLEDRLSVLVLRLLGHRWPKQLEVGEPAPEWAEPGGIIPLTVATGRGPGSTPLAERLRAGYAGV